MQKDAGERDLQSGVRALTQQRRVRLSRHKRRILFLYQKFLACEGPQRTLVNPWRGGDLSWSGSLLTAPAVPTLNEAGEDSAG